MMRIEKYSHGFKVLTTDVMHREICRGFGRTLTIDELTIDPKTRATTNVASVPYASRKAKPINTESWDFIFHIADLPGFLAYYDECRSKRDFTIVECSKARSTPAEFVMEMTPRDEEQEEALEFICKDEPIRVLHADTGFGKTFLGFKWAAHYGERIALVMEPVHIKTWVEKAKEYMGIDDKDIINVVGKSGFQAAIEEARLGRFNYKLVCISAPSLREYIKAYESDPEFDFDVEPMDLFPHLGIGRVIRDEAHEALRAMIVQTSYMDVKSIMFLSATLVDGSPKVMDMYAKVFPKKDRFESSKNAHLKVYPCIYSTDPRTKLACNGTHGYSHIKLEKDILKRKILLESYFQIIDDVIDKGHIKIKHPDGKMLIFFSTVAMCEAYAKYLQKRLPDASVGVYVQGSPESVLGMQYVTTTIKSCGTGKDIPDVESIFLTIGLGSEKTSRQIAGRGRKSKKFEPRFFYLVNTAIGAQVKYDINRRRYMALRAKYIRPYRIPVRLTSR